MKLAQNVQARIGTRIGALALTGGAELAGTGIGGAVIGAVVIGGAAPAGAAVLTPHAVAASTAAGTALSRGDTATANADLARADDMAWDVLEATFGAIERVPVHG